MTLKQLLIGTAAGRFAMHARETLTLWRTIRTSPGFAATLLSEQCAMRLLTMLCKPGATFVDVGSHYGSVIAAVMDRNASIKVIAIEAIPAKVQNLRRKFPQVQIHACAAGETDGEVEFFVDQQEPDCSTLGKPTGEHESHVLSIKVPMRRLDGLIPAADVDVMKIDVIGAELGVVRGASDLIARCRPLIVFESGPATNDGLGYTKQALWEWFTDHQYQIVVPSRVPHDAPPLTCDGFLESHFYPMRTINYCAIPSERRIEIRDRAREVVDTK